MISSIDVKKESPGTSIAMKTFGEKAEIPSESVSLSNSSSHSPLVVIKEN